MKSSIILSIVAAVPFVMGMAQPEAEAAVERLEAHAQSEIMPRACTKTSCNCLAIPNGLFCGDGLLGCKKGYVYQCGGDGKLSCEYGVRNSCKKCNKLQC